MTMLLSSLGLIYTKELGQISYPTPGYWVDKLRNHLYNHNTGEHVVFTDVSD